MYTYQLLKYTKPCKLILKKRDNGLYIVIVSPSSAIMSPAATFFYNFPYLIRKSKDKNNIICNCLIKVAIALWHKCVQKT